MLKMHWETYRDPAMLVMSIVGLWSWLFIVLGRIGFIDSASEAGECFWSWPWNCKHGHGLYLRKR